MFLNDKMEYLVYYDIRIKKYLDLGIYNFNCKKEHKKEYEI